MYERRNNALRDPDEVLAWALTNRQMQAFMESIPYGERTLWQRFVETIRTFLGLPARADTALSEVLRIADDLLNAPVDQLMTQAKTLGLPTQINQYEGLSNNQRSTSRIIGDAGRQYTPAQRQAMTSLQFFSRPGRPTRTRQAIFLRRMALSRSNVA